MTNKPLVSAIMAAYNAERYIGDSIKAVLDQTHENIQLIVVNDGSTDGTAEIVRSFGDPRIELINLPKNRHIANATNVGFSYVKGEYVAIVDADDLWYPTKIERQLEFMKENPQYSCTFTWTDIMDEHGNVINEAEKEFRDLLNAPNFTRGEWLRMLFFERNRFCNPAAMFTTESMKKTGPHSLFYIQATDMEWWVRYLRNFEVGMIEEPLMCTRRSTQKDSVSSVNDTTLTRFFNEYSYIRYHFFDDMDDELFIKEFGRYFRCPDSRTPLELECEKAFLLSSCFSISLEYSALGILKLEELMYRPETAELLYNKYHFSTVEIGKVTGRHLFNDRTTQELLINREG